MRSLLQELVAAHATIEAGLDRLAAGLAENRVDAEVLREIADCNRRHYEREETFLAVLQQHEPALTAKLRAQHEEAFEIAGRLLEAIASGDKRDAHYLARRFLAISRHNIIEEERDVFPLAQRFLEAEE